MKHVKLLSKRLARAETPVDLQFVIEVMTIMLNKKMGTLDGGGGTGA